MSIVLDGTNGLTLPVPLTIGNLPSGSWILLNTLTASSSASLSDTTSFTSTYYMNVIVFQNILPATNAVGLNMLVQSGGSFQATNYSAATFISNNGTAAATPGGIVTTAFSISSGARLSNTASGGLDGMMIIPNPSQTSYYKQIYSNGTYWDSSTQYSFWYCYGAWKGGTGAITGVQFAMSSGNIASGIIKIYGVKA